MATQPGALKRSPRPLCALWCSKGISSHAEFSLNIPPMRLTAIAVAAFGLVQAVAGLTYKGADFSSLALMEKAGRSFTQSGSKQPLEKILASQGCNAARIRVWTAGDYNLAYGLALAKRVKAAGMKVMVDLHFSDTCE